jgi:hypothetical protein
MVIVNDNPAQFSHKNTMKSVHNLWARSAIIPQVIVGVSRAIFPQRLRDLDGLPDQVVAGRGHGKLRWQRQ